MADELLMPLALLNPVTVNEVIRNYFAFNLEEIWLEDYIFMFEES